MVTYLQCPETFLSTFMLQVVAASPVRYAFVSLKCMALFQIAVVWQSFCIHVSLFFLRRSASGLS
jgi:hypothetical protein